MIPTIHRCVIQQLLAFCNFLKTYKKSRAEFSHHNRPWLSREFERFKSCNWGLKELKINILKSGCICKYLDTHDGSTTDI